MTDAPTPWWMPSAHADRRPFLAARGRVRRSLEAWFDAEGFTFVECGALQISPGNETHLHAFQTQFVPEGGAARPVYLHTSPEFASKKLLAAGETRIVDFARVYRNRERGPLHAPEFTMVEWYRAGVDLAAVMDDCAALARAAAGERPLSWRGRTADAHAAPEYLTLEAAFERYAGIELDAVLDDREGLAQGARRLGLSPRVDDQWTDIFSAVLVAHIEPHLGNGQLTFLHRYPVCEAALARACVDDPRYAERFELYACGVELANGFCELTEPQEQRRRFEADMELKQSLYGERYPIDEDFLSALAHMPAASGVALGFDRLVMLASGARHINDVLWTPFPA